MKNMAAQPISIDVDLSPKTVVLKNRADDWPERAGKIVVRDQESYDLAAKALRAIKLLRDEIEETFGPIVKKAYELHRAAVAQRKKVEAPLEDAERILKGSISAFQQQQDQLRRAEEARLNAEAERRAAEEREREIEEAEAASASLEEVWSIAMRPLNVAPVLVPPTVQRAVGISQRENWKATVTDLKLLVEFVARNPAHLNLVEPNQVAINTMARSLKSTMSIPGIRIWNEPAVAVRR